MTTTTATETMTMTSDQPQRMACAVGRDLARATRDSSPRMTMLASPVMAIAEPAVATEPEPELDAAARLRRAAHDAIAAFARSKA
ncbi:MAG TPA: hypothetical protein VGG28_03905 [Kofleriaceae bacterium]